MSFGTLRRWFGSGRGSTPTSPATTKRPRPYRNETGSKFFRVRFARESHRAAVKRQMRTERRWARGRNTRGLPVGMGEHMRGPALTDRLNRQARLRRDRPSRLARLVAALNRTQPALGFEIRYSPSPRRAAHALTS